MAVEEIGRLRTIALVGQGSTGKTQLAEAMLFSAGMTTRLGRPDDGTALMDFEPEELSRHISISSSFHHLNWKRTELILANTPGYTAFLPDAFGTMRAVDGVVFVASAGRDLKVESEKIFEQINRLGLPRLAFVSRLDRERMDFDAAMTDLEKLAAKPIALSLPIGAETAFSGVIDVLAMKALIYPDSSGKAREDELSGELRSRAEAARTNLCEAVAETDDSLLEKYLEQGELDEAELRSALRAAVLAGKLTPVLCGSGAKNVGVDLLLDAAAALLPAPSDRPPFRAQGPSNGTPIERAADPDAPFSAFVFKTVIDPFAGKLSIFRVVSGRATSDAAVLNATRSSKERFGQLLRLEGKKQAPLSSALPGEIVAVAKLKDTTTGDTLCDEKRPILFPMPERPLPVISFAIRPKTRGDEEKASQALARLVEEDPASGDSSRSTNSRDHSRRHRPDAYRGDGRKAQAQIQCGCRVDRAQSALQGDHQGPRRGAGQVQAAVWRPGSVR